MIERIAAPVDPRSLLPLPVSIEQSTFPLPNGQVLYNQHHAYFPAASMQGGEAWLAAVRQFRLERLPIGLHGAYHRAFIDAQLPADEAESFKSCVMAIAGHIPEQGVAFDSCGSWRLVPLPKDERKRLWMSGTIHHGTTDIIRKFMLSYVARQGRIAADLGLVDELIDLNDPELSMDIGRLLLLACSEAATKPFSEQYSQARKDRLIPPVRSRQVGSFVCNLLSLGPKGYVSLSAIKNFLGALAAPSSATCITGLAIV